MTPRTCVITVNYRGAENTAACISSLVGSSHSLSMVVVDNTPNDPVLREALEPYPEVVLLRAKENLGFGRGNNLGIDWALKNTGCEFIFILNNDATVGPNTIQKLEAAMDEHQEAGIIAPRIVLAEDRGLLWYGGGEVDWKRGGGRVPGFLGPAEAPLAMTSREVSFASGCAMLIRRNIAEQTRGFDPRFFMYEEDLELSIRVTKSGWKIRYVPGALVFHEGQRSLRGKNQPFTGKWDIRNDNFSFHAYHMVRNAVINAITHARGRDAWVFLVYYPVSVISRLMPHFMRLRFGSIVPVVRGVWDGLHSVRERRSV